jgi:hypothetical protein
MRHRLIDAQQNYLSASDRYSQQRIEITRMEEEFGEGSHEQGRARAQARRIQTTRRSQRHRLIMYNAYVTRRRNQIYALGHEIISTTRRIQDLPLLPLANPELLHRGAEALRFALQGALGEEVGRDE